MRNGFYLNVEMYVGAECCRVILIRRQFYSDFETGLDLR